jgi:hypothetical protein
MSLDALHPTPATAPPLPPPAPAPAPAAAALPFQRLLDTLQRLTDEQRRASAGGDADQLRQALRAADDGFVTAMDLRQQLEAAFRAQRP